MKICLIAQFPPPIHGLSKAVATLYKSKLQEKYHFNKINITNNFAFLVNVIKLLFNNSDLFYLTVSQSRGGNLRDLFILSVLNLRHKRFGVHVHGGLHYREVIDGMVPAWQSKLNRVLLSHASFAIVLSESLRGNFSGIVDENKIFVIENGVEEQNILPPSVMKTIEDIRIQPQKPQHVLFLSNMIESKGYRLVLELALKEKQRVELGKPQRYLFDFAGKFFDISEKEYFTTFVSSNDISKFIMYHGVVEGTEKQQLLEHAAVFCLPTWYPIEGQPISILEAMANGEYIISTKHAAIGDLVDPAGGTLFGRSATTDDYYSRLLELTSEDLSRAFMHNYNVVRNQYTESSYIERFSSLFSKLEVAN